MKISKQLTDTVAKAIRQGSTQRSACITVGISEVNYYRWRKRGEEILEAGSVCENKMDKACLYFYQETEKAHADYAFKSIKPVEKAGIENWRAAAWILERRYRKLFGRPPVRRIYVESEDGEPRT